MHGQQGSAAGDKTVHSPKHRGAEARGNPHVDRGPAQHSNAPHENAPRSNNKPEHGKPEKP
jgi:hypothetical protein